MPDYTQNTTLGKILEDHPTAVDLLNSSGRLQVDRFRSHELFVAAPYLGMSQTKMQEFLTAVNKMKPAAKK